MRLLVIANPSAGKQTGTDELSPAADALRAEGHVVEIVEAGGQGHAGELAATRAKDFDRVAAAGGDGTVSEVFQGLYASGSPAVMALIPCGTANDFATAAGVSMDPGRALLDAVRGNVFRVDLGRAGDRVFLNAATAGPAAEISEATSGTLKKLLGGASYVVSAILHPQVLEPVEATLRGGGERLHGPVLAFTVANGRTVGGGTGVAPFALIDDGELDIAVLPGGLPAGELVAAARALRSGQDHDALVRLRGRSFRFDAPEDTLVTLDGEPVSARTLTFEALPGALRLVLPDDCPLLARNFRKTAVDSPPALP